MPGFDIGWHVTTGRVHSVVDRVGIDDGLSDCATSSCQRRLSSLVGGPRQVRKSVRGDDTTGSATPHVTPRLVHGRLRLKIILTPAGTVRA